MRRSRASSALGSSQKSELKVEVRDGVLVVEGEKRFEQQAGTGQYRLLQCAYGRFQRAVPLPVPVRGDRARAAYRDGVLRIGRAAYSN